MTEWIKIFKYRDSFTIDEAARIFHNVDPICGKIHIGIIAETKEDINNAIKTGDILFFDQLSNNHANPEQKIDKISFLNWCAKRGVPLEYLLPDEENSIKQILFTDDMPDTMKIVWTLWHELRQNEGRLTLQSVTQEIDSRYANLNLNDELKKSCARVLIGTSQAGRPPKKDS